MINNSTNTHIDDEQLAFYQYTGVIANSLTTALLTFAIDRLLPKIKNNLSDYNIHLFRKKIKILLMGNHYDHPIERFLSHNLDYNIHRSIVRMSEFLHIEANKNDQAKEQKTDKGRFCYIFPNAEIQIRNLNGEKLDSNVLQNIRNNDFPIKDMNAHINNLESTLNLISDKEELKNHFVNSVNKWFIRGKARISITRTFESFLSNNYFIGDLDVSSQLFTPFAVISVIDKSRFNLKNQDLDYGKLESGFYMHPSSPLGHYKKQNNDNIEINID